MILMRPFGLGSLLLVVPLACSSTVPGTGTSGGTSGSSGTSGTTSGGTSGTTSGGTSGTALVGSSGGDSQTTGTKAVASCNLLIDAVYGIAVRCGYSDTRQQIEQSATGSTCSDIAAIRDDDELRNACIPYLDSIGVSVDCSEFEVAGLDPSCQKQLIGQ